MQTVPRLSTIALPSGFEYLRNERRWLVWRLGDYDIAKSKWGKIPVHPITGRACSPVDETLWQTFDDALRLRDQHNAYGIGIGLNGDGLIYADLDHAINPVTGDWHDWATELVEEIGGPISRSISGSGLQAFFHAYIDDSFKTKTNAQGAEYYVNNRFVALTFDWIEGTEDRLIEDRTSLAHRVLGRVTTDTPIPPTTEPETISDDEVISTLCADEKAADLWDGHWEGSYESQSHADLALSRLITNLTGFNREQWERIFGQSELAQRVKWKTKKSYRDLTWNTLISESAFRVDIPKGKKSPNGSVDSRNFQPRLVSSFKFEAVTWLWPNYIPLGKATHIFGEPGQGKSNISLDLIARVTRGDIMPDGSRGEIREPAGAIVVATEDEVEDTVGPRLAAAGADLDRVAVLRIPTDEHGVISPQIPEDIDSIKRAIQKVNARLIVFDPIVQMLSGKTDSWKDQDVRAALAPMASLAADTDCALIFIQHLNKNISSDNIMHRGSGATAWTAFSRSVMFAQGLPNVDDKGEPIGGGPYFALSVAKINIAKLPPSLKYRIVGTEPGELGYGEKTGLPILSQKIQWLESMDVDAQGLYEKASGKNRSDGSGRARVQDLNAFFKELFVDGPVRADEVKRQAELAGIPKSILDKSEYKKLCNVRPRKQRDPETGDQAWFWYWETVITDDPDEKTSVN